MTWLGAPDEDDPDAPVLGDGESVVRAAVWTGPRAAAPKGPRAK